MRARSSAKVKYLNRRFLPYDQSKRKRRRKNTESTKLLVPEWGQLHGFEDLAIDSQRGRVYASSANMNTILVFDLQGKQGRDLSAEAARQTGGVHRGSRWQKTNFLS